MGERGKRKGYLYIKDEILDPYFIAIERGDVVNYIIKEKGKEKKVVGYYGTLHGALRAVLEFKLNNSVFKDGDEVSLETYISSLQSSYDSLGYLMNKILNKHSEIKN